jgi:hypothetical protein
VDISFWESKMEKRTWIDPKLVEVGKVSEAAGKGSIG